jgi:hypothetical protein
MTNYDNILEQLQCDWKPNHEEREKQQHGSILTLEQVNRVHQFLKLAICFSSNQGNRQRTEIRCGKQEEQRTMRL